MLLKRITMAGFKSFADKVDFDFGPGVTCIVGPNGCGKSNVVDAIKWVLGEQSAKSLRGRQMIDMIFNGSSSRKSASVAQIDIMFDNRDRTLPLDQEEVTVSRKLYRSGESEYLVNGDTMRLKDIREMFMDTGVGTEAYTIIEQGKVDVLLQSSPGERRVIFEEAAGISRFKARKREAERKMDRTQQNLLRVEDIVEEIEKRLRSVKLQAGKARNYLEYEGRLNDLKASYSMAEYHRFTQTLTKLTAEMRGLDDQHTELTAQIGQTEAQESEILTSLDRLTEEISEADNHLAQARSDQTTHQERIDAARRRMADQEELLERTVSQRSVSQSRLDGSRAELAESQESAASLGAEVEALRAQVSEYAEQDEGLTREAAQARAILEDEKAGVIELLRRSAQTHNEIIRLNTRRESLDGQKGRLRVRDEQIKVELQESMRRRSDLEQRLAEVEELIAAETARLEEKKAEAIRVEGLRQNLTEQLSSAKQSRSALVSRQEVLCDLERKMEGVGAGVRKLLDAKEANPNEASLQSICGLVADVFDTDVSHAQIIEAALGDADQCLVVSSGSQFEQAVEWIGDLPGRVAALCLDRLPALISERSFSAKPGFVARAIDLVRFPEEMRNLARHLLGRTIVVQDMQTAKTLASEDAAGYRFVTLAGELVDSLGRVSLGPPSSRAGLISRKSELKDIDIQMAVVDEEIARLTDSSNRYRAEAEHLDRIQQELRGAVYESNTAKVEANAALKSVRESVERLSNEQPVIAREVDSIEQEMREVLEKSEQGDESLDKMKRENEQREQNIAERQEKIDEIDTRRKEVQAKLTELKVAAGQVEEKRAAAASSIAAITRQIRELEETIRSSASHEQKCREQIEHEQSSIENSEQSLAAAQSAIEETEALAQELRTKREQLRVDLEELGRQMKTIRAELSGAESKRHELGMSLAETKVRRDELHSRVQSELDIDLAERYESYEHAEQDWEAVEEEIAELRGKIARLGNVNIDAIKELDELEERHEFLSNQRDDLMDSLKQLEQLIEKLDNESLHRFREAFDAIREHFRTLFRKLFGGGRADVILEEPENPLECGIEILAQPPGKELQSISLMSGGEKTMTAIALLMSVFKSRPAPFVFLDEVDAALDEANNERFNQIVSEFTEDSQFIIITHSKRTMGIGSRLYGITMQEPGISTRVSVELADAQVA